MTVYRDVLKDGKELYVAGGGGLYRINLKNMKVKKLAKISASQVDDMVYHSMTKKGNYLYFKRTSGIVMTLYRVNLNSNKAKKIVDLSRKDYSMNDYVISGKKLYYNCNNIDNENISRNYIADLNGKHQKPIRTKIVMKSKISNAKQYSIVKKWDYDNNICYDYLRTPKKTYYLGASK